MAHQQQMQEKRGDRKGPFQRLDIKEDPPKRKDQSDAGHALTDSSGVKRILEPRRAGFFISHGAPPPPEDGRTHIVRRSPHGSPSQRNPRDGK